MKRYKPLFEDIQANQIAKELIKAGYKKAGFKRVNFKTIPFGDYEVKQLKIYGLNVITVLP